MRMRKHGQGKENKCEGERSKWEMLYKVNEISLTRQRGQVQGGKDIKKGSPTKEGKEGRIIKMEREK